MVFQRPACPPPEQPFPQPCTTGDAKLIYEGLGMSTVATGLFPYSAYEFLLQVENDAGRLDFPEWVKATTMSAGMVSLLFSSTVA